MADITESYSGHTEVSNNRNMSYSGAFSNVPPLDKIPD
jgi:hypothetical protein